jgi:hypothetical protein
MHDTVTSQDLLKHAPDRVCIAGFPPVDRASSSSLAYNHLPALIETRNVFP